MTHWIHFEPPPHAEHTQWFAVDGLTLDLQVTEGDRHMWSSVGLNPEVAFTYRNGCTLNKAHSYVGTISLVVEKHITLT